MIVKRDVFASLVILGFLLISCVDIFTGLEHWPFGSYPMYSTVYPEQLSWLRLYGVTDGGEIPLRGEQYFAPFDEARLISGLDRLQSAPGGKQKLADALRNLVRLYNRQAVNPPLRALRLYRVQWTLQTGLTGSEPPRDRILLAQVDNEAAP